MPPSQRSPGTAPQSRHSASLRETSASKSKAKVIFPLPSAIEAPLGTAEERMKASQENCREEAGPKCAPRAEGGQEPCALAGAPLCTTEQLYQPRVLTGAPEHFGVHGSGARSPHVPWLGSVLPAPPSASPTQDCPAPPSTGPSVPHKHQGELTLLLTESASALSPHPLYTGTGGGGGTCTQLAFKL